MEQHTELPRLVLSKAAASRITGVPAREIHSITQDEFGVVLSLEDGGIETLKTGDFWKEFREYRANGGRELQAQIEFLGIAREGEPTWQVNDYQVCWHPRQKVFSCGCGDAFAQGEYDIPTQCKHVCGVAMKLGGSSLKDAATMLSGAADLERLILQGEPQKTQSRPKRTRLSNPAASAASLYQTPRPDDYIGNISIA